MLPTKDDVDYTNFRAGLENHGPSVIERLVIENPMMSNCPLKQKHAAGGEVLCPAQTMRFSLTIDYYEDLGAARVTRMARTAPTA